MDKVKGQFHFQIHDVDGTLLWEERVPNGSTTVGRNHMLSTEYAGGTPITAWFIGLVDNSGFSAFAAADTMASHAGWAESVAYSEGARQAFTPGSAASGVISSSSPAVFTASGTVTLHGAFLTELSTKGGTTGILAATGAFSSNQTLTVGQTLSVSYSRSLTT